MTAPAAIRPAVRRAGPARLRALAAAALVLGPLLVGPAGAQTVPSRAGPLSLTPVVALDHPWGMAFLPDGGLLVTEKPGRLRILRDDALSGPVAGVPPVAYRDQGGLLDVEIDPRFAENGFVYLSYAEPAATPPDGRDVADPRLGPYQSLDDGALKGLAVARARLRDGSLSELAVIWRAPKTVGRGHFGGRLAFAPDGMLLVTVGERQRFEPAQDRASALGKVIRIRPDGSLPPDNPFADGPEGGRAVWSLGHRNPLGLLVRPGTGEIWINEMGPLGGDEVNRIERGGNYGWPIVSTGDHYDKEPIPRPGMRPDLRAAAQAWNPSVSPSGLALYAGNRLQGWTGSLVMGGLSSQALIRVAVPPSGGAPDVEVIPMGFRVRDVIEAPDGALLILKDGADGALLRLTPPE